MKLTETYVNIIDFNLGMHSTFIILAKWDTLFMFSRFSVVFIQI